MMCDEQYRKHTRKIKEKKKTLATGRCEMRRNAEART